MHIDIPKRASATFKRIKAKKNARVQHPKLYFLVLCRHAPYRPPSGRARRQRPPSATKVSSEEDVVPKVPRPPSAPRTQAVRKPMVNLLAEARKRAEPGKSIDV